MVYYFTSNVVSPSAFIYVGKDKFESMRVPPRRKMPADSVLMLMTCGRADEELIKFGWEEDVWYVSVSFFHLFVRTPLTMDRVSSILAALVGSACRR